jgi:hypothetical protein
MTKIAFLFLTIDNINHPFFWEEYFKNNDDKINIYCHPKNPENVTIPWLKKNIISKLVETDDGYITKAYFNLLAAALGDKDNIKFITISESCIPLIPFNKLYKNIMEYPQKSYIKFMKIQESDLNEIRNHNGYERYMCGTHKVTAKAPACKLLKHYARFCLSRHHTKILLNKKEDFIFFNKMYKGAEFFLSLLNPFNNIDDFAITYDNLDLIDNIINNKKRAVYEKLEEKELVNNKLIKLQEDVNITIEDIKKAKSTNSYFWRQFPKNSNIIKYKTQFEYITKSKELYFIHIPKSAGTSIAEIFYKHLNMDIGFSYYKYKNKHLKTFHLLDENIKNSITLKFNPWHIPFSFFNRDHKNHILKNYKIFAIVRNPFDRIISEYGFWIKYYKLHKNDKYLYNFINELKEIYNTFEANPQNLNNFIQKVLGNNKYEYELDGHLIPMYKYVYVNKTELIAEILKYENLNIEFNKFIKNNNINLPKDSLLVTHSNTSGIQLTRKHLDDKSIKLIQEYYKKDFELFGYDKLI